MGWLNSGRKMSSHVPNQANLDGALLVAIGSQIDLIIRKNLVDVFARWIIIVLGWEAWSRRHVSIDF